MQNADCDKCGLLEVSSGPVPDDGGDYTILVVGEAPGVEEDRVGRPFVGKSGKFLRGVLNDLGYPEDLVTYTNVVRCHPPGNKMKAKYIKCCYQNIPIRDNTRLVVLLGNIALKAVLGESGISTWNGIVVDRDGVAYLSLFHPAYFLRRGIKRGDPELQAWLDALDKAIGIIDNPSSMPQPKDAHYEYVLSVRTLEDVDRMCAELMKSPMIAFDTEVSRLDAYAVDSRMLMVSFATADTAWAVPVDHPDLAPLDDESIDAICTVLERHPCIIGHNVKFDQIQCAALLNCEFYAAGDTMLLSYLHKSKRGLHGLKRLSGMYLGMYDYDEELRDWVDAHPECNYKRGGSYGNVPLTILLPYAAWDAAATYLLHDLLYDLLSPKQQDLYHELYVLVSNTLSRLQSTGMAVDYAVVDRYVRVYTMYMNQLLEIIKNNPMVQNYVALRRHFAKTKHERESFEFNPGSWQQKAVVLYGVDECKFVPRELWKPLLEGVGKLTISYGLKPQGYSNSGNPSTSRDNIKIYRDKCPLVDNLVMYGMIQKMLGTYIEPIADGTHVSADGRVRANFNQHVVETGRLSSSNPNMQNIPTPEKEPGTILQYQPIKNMFTHTWDGGCLMFVDYAGMELRVFASLAECESMIDIHKSGKDFHRMVGHMISGIPVDDITKEQRYRYKWTNWTILFGGSEYTLYTLYGIPLDEGKAVIDAYFRRFPEVRLYQKRCIDFARQHGYVETPFGNRRMIPDINSVDAGKRTHAEREAINTPVQGTAGLVTVMAMTIVDNLMLEAGYKSLIINTVHDSIGFDVYPGEKYPLACLVVDVMENVKEYAKTWMPHIDMDWLICPLKADVEVGSHYGNMVGMKLEVA